MDNSEVIMCRCGKNPAVLNSDGSYELCMNCRSQIFESKYAEMNTEIGFGSKYAKASLNDFREDLVADLRKDTKDFTSASIMFNGASSTGKTYIMSAICNELLRKGITTSQMLFMNVIELYAMIGRDITQFEEIVSRCAEADYLFLDEVTPAKTDWEHRALYLILERRKNYSLVTFSTTNYELNKLNGQIVSRLLDYNGVKYTLTRNSWRKN